MGRLEKSNSIVSNLFIAAVLVTFSQEAVSAQERVDIDQLRAAVSATLSSLSSIDAEYSVRFEPRADSDSSVLKPWGPERYTCTIQGAQRILRLLNPEAGRPYETYASDGTRSYDYIQYDSQTMLTIHSEATIPHWPVTSPASMVGLSITQTSYSLEELLSRPNARVVSTNADGDSSGWTAEVDGFSNSDGKPLKLVVAIDPKHDHLPRMLEVRYDTNDPDLAGAYYRWTIDAFSQVHDQRAGGSRWFPTSGTFDQTGHKHFVEVGEVKINTQFTTDHFRPKPDEGTQVTDEATGKNYVVGGLPAADKVVQESVRRAREQVERVEQPVFDARPPRSRWLSVFRITFWASLVLAGGTVVWFILQRR